jgi:flagellar biosynthesis protein FliP
LRHKAFWLLVSLPLLLALPDLVSAQTLPLVTTKGTGANTTYSVPVETLLALTALSFLPAALILLTSFTRILIVFSLLRQALGLTTMPPNIVLIGLSFFLTLFIMNPVFENIYQKAYQPYTAGKMNFSQAVDVGSVPLKEFMLKQTRRDDLNSVCQNVWQTNQ